MPNMCEECSKMQEKLVSAEHQVEHLNEELKTAKATARLLSMLLEEVKTFMKLKGM